MSEEEKQLTVIKPAMDLTDYKSDIKSMMQLVKDQMRPDWDYGLVPYAKTKSLFQPGAEKLAKYFGLVPEFELVKEIEDFDKNFIYYKYKCRLIHFKTGKAVGEVERSSNSREKTYQGKTIYDLVNPVQAKAQKRAFVAAVRAATLASEIFHDHDEPETDGERVTKKEDPARIKLLGRLFSTAADRGFSSDQVKKAIHSKYNIESTTQATNAQLTEAIENMLDRYEVVPAGKKPKLRSLDNSVDKNKTPVDNSTGAKSAEEPVQEGVVVDQEEKSFCRTCNAPLPPEVYFCPDKDCQEQYYGKDKKKSPAERDWKFK